MDKKCKKLFKAVIWLGVIAVITLLFRAWTLFVVAIAMFIGASIWLRLLKVKASKEHAEKLEIIDDAPVIKQDSICEQVSIWVKLEYPNAKWVWAQSDTLRRVANGDEVFIILNGAGGYRRAKVSVCEGNVEAIEFVAATVKNESEHHSDIKPTENQKSEEPKDDFGLLAFEWVESHINELNERLNNALGQGDNELVIKACELPLQNSWNSVCEELKRVGLSDAECVQEGIKLKLMQ